jgi:hypothetical protein
MKPNEVDEAVAEQGFFGALLMLNRSDRRDEELIRRLAEIASSRNALISEQDLQVLNRVSGTNFFMMQMLVCEVIPLLKSAPSEVMGLAELFVEKGGEDLAANQPNAAFREWCASDSRRADDVIASAREGDALAIRHLVFALEAKRDFQEAFRSAEADGAERTAGVLALSRMLLSQEEAERALAHILKLADATEAGEGAGFLTAAIDIAAKHPGLDRRELARSLDQISESNTPLAIHFLATALHGHSKEMTAPEVQSCLKGILRVDPKNKGTVREIDWALANLWEADPVEAGHAGKALIALSEGEIGSEELNSFFAAIENGDRRQLARLATDWLMDGEFHVCSALTSLFSEINRTTPCVDVFPDDLPSNAVDQIFLCRKAIGYLFISPMTAASWCVAVLRRDDAEAASEVADLLFDPLLLNYGGTLKDWLEEVVKVDAPGTDAIASALSRAESLCQGAEAARAVVELVPPASHRALVRFQEAEEANQIQVRAREKSIFAKLVTTQTLLYGDQSSFSRRDRDGNRSTQVVKMAEISVRSELPKGIVFDPVGTEWLLDTYRLEQRKFG